MGTQYERTSKTMNIMTSTTMIKYVFLLTTCAVVRSYPQTMESDETELLKCKVEALEKSSREQQILLDAMRGKIEAMERSELQQNRSLSDVIQQSSKLSTYCSLLPKNICGDCRCLDDYEHEKKWYCDCQHLPPKRDCVELLQHGHKISGVYKINAGGIKSMQVFCDQETDQGGWTVIQRRVNGEINFYRNWQMYKHGFGSHQREFWIGNDNIHVLSLQAAYPKGSELRIDMVGWEDKKAYAKYSSFKVDGEKEKYTLHVSGYSGTAGDSFGGHNGYKFSTYDSDNDIYEGSCSRNHRGAWWYERCHSSNLNGEYLWFDVKQPGYARGVIWWAYKKTDEYSLKSVEMKMRREI